jgi:N-acetylglutamate synthase-like GNAT family acetyltransferase
MISIRPATDDDNVAAEAIARRAFDELRRVYRPNGSTTAAGLPMVRLVAEIGGQIIGTITYAVQSDRLHLRGLAVDAGCRRTGAARELIEYAGDIARTEGLRALSLYTVKQTGNVPVFERLGFHTVREEPATWAVSECGGELTDVFMEKLV